MSKEVRLNLKQTFLIILYINLVFSFLFLLTLLSLFFRAYHYRDLKKNFLRYKIIFAISNL